MTKTGDSGAVINHTREQDYLLVVLLSDSPAVWPLLVETLELYSGHLRHLAAKKYIAI